MKKSIPTGVKVISILYYIGAAILGIFGILFMIGAGFVANNPLFAELGTMNPGMFIVIGIILIGFGVLSFFIGRGLWKVQKWARIIAIVFAVLGIINGLISMIQGVIVGNLISIAINAVIGGYLYFNKDVKKAFD